jgi:predicted AAA+ superfamily ATPase
MILSNSRTRPFERRPAETLRSRLGEPRRVLQVVAGPRQVGKTTLVAQVLSPLDVPNVVVSADEPAAGGTAWLAAQWDRARIVAAGAGKTGAVLALDEVQKITGWSETVKRLWDEDSRARRPLKVVLLGSAPLLIQHGLTESLAGRFEIVHLPHWSYAEMRAAFGFSLEQYLYFGGAFKPTRTLLVGGDGIALDEFLTRPVEHWLQA